MAEWAQWAHEAPADTSRCRYAIVYDDCGAVAWTAESPNPELSPRMSSGRFYDDMSGGAVAAAVRAVTILDAASAVGGVISEVGAVKGSSIHSALSLARQRVLRLAAQSEGDERP